ncbi:MAG: hypothetical protein CL916_01985 [Deltaproteobacteria bacterium]|nr:hypothetical protein [Deltaproteobacteria bacterium]
MVPVTYMTVTQVVVFLVVIVFLQSSSIIFLASCLFISSVTCFCLMGYRSETWFCRQDVWFVARWTCVWVWLGSVIGYSLYFFANQKSFSFSIEQLWFIAPLISFAPALMSVILTMCAGDTALFILEKEEH